MFGGNEHVKDKVKVVLIPVKEVNRHPSLNTHKSMENSTQHNYCTATSLNREYG